MIIFFHLFLLCITTVTLKAVTSEIVAYSPKKESSNQNTCHSQNPIHLALSIQLPVCTQVSDYAFQEQISSERNEKPEDEDTEEEDDEIGTVVEEEEEKEKDEEESDDEKKK